MSKSESGLPSWIWDPASKIRQVIFGALVGGIISLVTPLLDGLLLIFRGSVPGASMSDPTWGVADFVIALPTLVARALTGVLTAYFDLVVGVPRALLGSNPGPFLGALTALVVVVEIIATIELSRRVILALAAAVNLDAVTDAVFGGG